MAVYDLTSTNGRVLSTTTKGTSHYHAATKAGKYAFKLKSNNKNKDKEMTVIVRKHGDKQHKGKAYKIKVKPIATGRRKRIVKATSDGPVVFTPRYNTTVKYMPLKS